MSGLPRIMVIGVGGTIAMTGPGGAAVLPNLDAGMLVEAVPDLAAICEVAAITLSKAPSPHMDLRSVLSIADMARKAHTDGAEGIVVLQGTDTMEETAFALELLLGRSIPVAVTGAMRNPAQPGGEGPANLFAAARTAAARCGDMGVVVVMDGTIHAPRFVHKAHTASAAAFSPGPVALGEVTDSAVVFYAHIPPLPQLRMAVDAQPAAVALLEATLGEEGRLLDFVEPAGYHGLVIAGMGGGHVPPAMADRLEALAARMPVIVGSRTGAGTTLASTYAYSGGEIDLARRGVIRAGWLSPRKARVALALLLSADNDINQITDFFTSFGGGRVAIFGAIHAERGIGAEERNDLTPMA